MRPQVLRSQLHNYPKQIILLRTFARGREVSGNADVQTFCVKRLRGSYRSLHTLETSTRLLAVVAPHQEVVLLVVEAARVVVVVERLAAEDNVIPVWPAVVTVTTVAEAERYG